MDKPIYTEFGEISDEMGIQLKSVSDTVSHSSKTVEQELAALKNRRARLWDFFANPRTIVCDGQSKQRYEELCEINNEIARLEGGADPSRSQLEAAPAKFCLTSRIDDPGQIFDLEAFRNKMLKEMTERETDIDALREWGNRERNLELTNADAVEHPSHYTSGGIECIDAMKAMLAGYEQAKIATKFYWHFLSGQVLKYLWRWPLKERPLQDLKKARWYLDRLIADVESQDKQYLRKEAFE